MIEVIGLAILGYMISDWFLPIQVVKRKLKMYNWILFKDIVYCVKCTTFWLTLGILQSIYLAAIGAVLGYMIKFMVDYIETNYYDK